MRNLLSFAVLFVTLLFIGCGGSPQTLQSASTGDIPEWYTNVPQDPNYIFAPATASSQDMQLAVDKATTGARAEVARQVDVKVKGMQKKFEEETGVGNDAQLLSMFTQATKTVVSESLSGSRTKFQKHVKDGNLYRAYVLVEYPVGAAAEALKAQIKNNERMYTRFRESQAMKELDAEADKYDEFKKQQGK